MTATKHLPFFSKTRVTLFLGDFAFHFLISAHFGISSLFLIVRHNTRYAPNVFPKILYHIISWRFGLTLNFISAYLGIFIQNIVSKATNPTQTQPIPNKLKSPDYLITQITVQ